MKSGAPLADYNNSLLVQCMEAVVTKLNEQCPPVERVTFQVISNTKAKEYVKMMEAQKWTKESECDGLIAFSILYGFKHVIGMPGDPVPLDEYAQPRSYKGSAKAMECTFCVQERSDSGASRSYPDAGRQASKALACSSSWPYCSVSTTSRQERRRKTSSLPEGAPSVKKSWSCVYRKRHLCRKRKVRGFHQEFCQTTGT